MKIQIKGLLSERSHPKIHDSVKQAIKDMPEEIKEDLSHLIIKIAKRQIDIDPKYATRMARGFHQKTIEYAHGCYWPDTKEIWLVQEARSDECYDNMYVPASENLYCSFLHEVGHGFDEKNKEGRASLRSHADDMKNAYRQDLAELQRLDDKTRSELLKTYAYYFSSRQFDQGRHANEDNAREEVYADAFTGIIAGLTNSYFPEKRLGHQKLFAKCYAVVEKDILSVAPNAQLYPTYDRLYPKTCILPKTANECGNAFGSVIKEDMARTSPNQAAVIPRYMPQPPHFR